jgi:hypothetical protein
MGPELLEKYAKRGFKMAFPENHVLGVYYLKQIRDWLRPVLGGGQTDCDRVLAGLYGLDPPNPDGKNVPYFVYPPWKLYQETNNDIRGFVVDDYARGYESHWWCVGRSEYYVTWSVTQIS